LPHLIASSKSIMICVQRNIGSAGKLMLILPEEHPLYFLLSLANGIQRRVAHIFVCLVVLDHGVVKKRRSDLKNSFVGVGV